MEHLVQLLVPRDRAADNAFLLSNAFIILTMQGGFGMLEKGCVSSRSHANIMLKNLVDLAYGSVSFYSVGWGLAQGESAGGWFGTDQFFLDGIPENGYSSWVFNLAFAATAATIISGAVAGRMKFTVYMAASAFVTGLIYPMAAHWAWNADGFLAKEGYHDFAGCGPIHLLGGVMGVFASWYMKPRAGVFTDDGFYVPIRSTPSETIFGTILLVFGWMAFNTGSTLTLRNGADLIAGRVAVNTAIAGGSGTVTATLLSLWSRRGTPQAQIVDAFETATGALSGLVGITAACGCVLPSEAFAIGALVSAGTFYTPKMMHWMVIDDPVGVFPVHVVGGALGALCVGLFGQSNHVVTLSSEGLFHGGGLHQLGLQLWGVTMFAVWGVAWMAMFMYFIHKVITSPRISLEDEQKGLDEAEHGIVAMTLHHESFQAGRERPGRKQSLTHHGQEMLYFTTEEVQSAKAVNNDKEKRSSVVDKAHVMKSRRALTSSNPQQVHPAQSSDPLDDSDEEVEQKEKEVEKQQAVAKVQSLAASPSPEPLGGLPSAIPSHLRDGAHGGLTASMSLESVADASS